MPRRFPLPHPAPGSQTAPPRTASGNPLSRSTVARGRKPYGSQGRPRRSGDEIELRDAERMTRPVRMIQGDDGTPGVARMPPRPRNGSRTRGASLDTSGEGPGQEGAPSSSPRALANALGRST